MFNDVVDKYLDRTNTPVDDEDALHNINGIVLHKTSDALFYLSGGMVDEVLTYCRDKGYNLDNITFVSSYDIDLSYKRSVSTNDEGALVTSQSQRMESDSRFVIVEEKGRVTAKVFMGSSINIGRE